MEPIVLYGIKNCDTVRKSRKYLDGKSINFHFHDFRADGLTEDKVNNWIASVGMDVLLNKRSTTWKNLTEGEKQGDVVQLMCSNPTLVKRPVLEYAGNVFVGYSESSYDSALVSAKSMST